MIALDEFAGRDALLVGAYRDGRAVRVAAGDHQHVGAAHPVIASENVGGKIRPRDVAEMQRAVGVGPRDPDENAFRHTMSASILAGAAA